MTLVEAARAAGPVASPLGLFGVGLFGVGPKWTFQCGHCGHTFRQRLPMITAPTVRCPACSAENRVNVVVR